MKLSTVYLAALTLEKEPKVLPYHYRDTGQTQTCEPGLSTTMF